MPFLDRVGIYLRDVMIELRVPLEWQGAIIIALCVLLVMAVFRYLENWRRLVVVLLIALFMAKVYGLLPLPCEPGSGTTCG